MRFLEKECCSKVASALRRGLVCPPGGTASSGSVSFTVLDVHHLPAVKRSKSVHQIFTDGGRKCGELARG